MIVIKVFASFMWEIDIHPLDEDEIYNTKDDCENRYRCYNGDCRRTAGGEFLKMRHCDRIVWDIYNPDNPIY